MLCLYFTTIVAICGLIGALIFLPEKFDVKPQQLKVNLQQDIRDIIQRSYSRYNTTSFPNVVIDRIQQDFQCCGSSNYSDWYSSLQNNSTRPDIGVGNGAVAYITNPSPPRNSQFNAQSQRQIYSNRQEPPAVTTSFRVPVSCCSMRFGENSYNQCKNMIASYDANPSGQQIQRIPNVNQEGCVEKIHNYLFVVNWWPLNIIGGLAIGLQGLSLIFSICLCCAINRAIDDDDDYEEQKM